MLSAKEPTRLARASQSPISVACGGSPQPAERYEPLLTSQQAADLLGIHPKTLERGVKAGRIPGFKIGKFFRFRASALDAWIKECLESRNRVCRIETEF